MPKMKTRKSASKRLKKTAKGKIKRSKAYAGHIMTKKTRARKRNLRKKAVLEGSARKKLKKMMPYLEK